MNQDKSERCENKVFSKLIDFFVELDITLKLYLLIDTSQERLRTPTGIMVNL